jgi:hypothetical protein
MKSIEIKGVGKISYHTLKANTSVYKEKEKWRGKSCYSLDVIFPTFIKEHFDKSVKYIDNKIRDFESQKIHIGNRSLKTIYMQLQRIRELNEERSLLKLEEDQVRKLILKLHGYKVG